MGKGNEVHKRVLFFLFVLIILQLSFLASGLTPFEEATRKNVSLEALWRGPPLRFTQPPPPLTPAGDLVWGQICGEHGVSKDLLDCQETSEDGTALYGHCKEPFRCRQAKARSDKCLCL